MWEVPPLTVRRYLEACRTADVSNFKSVPQFAAIVGLANRRDGASLVTRVLAEVHPDLVARAKLNDRVGGAHIYGPLAADTAVYLHEAAEVLRAPQADAIVEIGGGYGGQYVVLRALGFSGPYVIHDLPEVLGLVARYCEAVGVEPPELRTPNDTRIPDAGNWLVFSRYALTELLPQAIDNYRPLAAPNAHAIGAWITGKGAGMKHVEETWGPLFRWSTLLSEFPLTHPDNKTVRYWRDS